MSLYILRIELLVPNNYFFKENIINLTLLWRFNANARIKIIATNLSTMVTKNEKFDTKLKTSIMIKLTSKNLKIINIDRLINHKIRFL